MAESDNGKRTACGPLRRIIIAAIVLATLSTACGGPVVFGHIPPTTFQFTTTVDLKDDEPGGWQIAQVVVLLGRLSNFFPRAAICEVEVGMPIMTELIGLITVEYAQISSAMAADRAARELMEKREIPTAPACIAFRRVMQEELRYPDGPIPGARVLRFSTDKVPRRTFPAKRGRR